MDPILTLISLVVLAPVIVVVMRALLVPSISADDLLQRTDLRWPHGVQEEEPARWHPERLRTPRPPLRDSIGPPGYRPGVRG